MRTLIKVVLAWIFVLAALVLMLIILQARAYGQTNIETIPTPLPPAVTVTNVAPLPPGYFAVHTRTECVVVFLQLSGFNATSAGMISMLGIMLCHLIRNTALKDSKHETSGIVAKAIAWVGCKPLDKGLPQLSPDIIAQIQALLPK